MGRKKEPNSWRSKGKGDCFTTKTGQVVCEGSKGMNYKPKGKKKSTAGEKTNSKGKKYKTIKIEPIGKEKRDKERGQKFVKEISQKTYQKNFVRI